jgi:dephospho-CoA kinase
MLINEICIQDSVRTINEVEFLRKTPHVYLILVESDINIRYGRIKKRNSKTYSVSFD